MNYKWDITAYAKPITYDGPLEPRAGASTKTLIGALIMAFRYLSGFYMVQYGYVEVGRHQAVLPQEQS
jgi:hypothetical protein